MVRIVITTPNKNTGAPIGTGSTYKGTACNSNTCTWSSLGLPTYLPPGNYIGVEAYSGGSTDFTTMCNGNNTYSACGGVFSGNSDVTFTINQVSPSNPTSMTYDNNGSLGAQYYYFNFDATNYFQNGDIIYFTCNNPTVVSGGSGDNTTAITNVSFESTSNSSTVTNYGTNQYYFTANGIIPYFSTHYGIALNNDTGQHIGCNINNSLNFYDNYNPSLPSVSITPPPTNGSTTAPIYIAADLMPVNGKLATVPTVVAKSGWFPYCPIIIF